MDNKITVGNKFTKEDKKECTITSFFVYDSQVTENTISDFNSFVSAYNHYKTIVNKRCDRFVSVGLNYNDNSLGGAIDLIYNEVVTANNIFLYGHDVMNDELEECTSLKDTIYSVVYYMTSRY